MPHVPPAVAAPDPRLTSSYQPSYGLRHSGMKRFIHHQRRGPTSRACATLQSRPDRIAAHRERQAAAMSAGWAAGPAPSSRTGDGRGATPIRLASCLDAQLRAAGEHPATNGEIP